MTLQQLRYIVAIDQYRHFGKAAEACDLTQSTLSLMVKKLEEELDVILFDRDAHPVEPTEMGRKVIAKAKVVLYNAAQITEITRSEKEILSGPLKIALISTAAPVLVPGLFKYLGIHHPAISLQTQEMLTDTIRDRLHKAEVDMGVLSAPTGDPELLEIPLWTERYFAYVSEHDPAYASETIQAKSLIGRPVWIMKEGVQLLDTTSLPESEADNYEHYFEGGRVGTLIQIVNDSGGLTMIPETHIDLILFSMQKNLRPIVNPELRRTVCLAIRKDYIHESLLNVVIKAVKSIIPGALLAPEIRKDYLRL